MPPSACTSTLSSTASFCWHPGTEKASGRNRFVRFFREFDLSAAAEAAEIRLFADTRYRLIVNGRIAGYGPARFYPSHTEADPHDLRAYLQTGSNRLEVEVWSAGSPNFQSVAAKAVFWADGAITDGGGKVHTLSTPGDWRAAVDERIEPDSVPLSFALGPVEIRDLSRTAATPSEAVPVVPVDGTGHAAPAERSIPEMTERLRRPQRLRYAGPGTTGGEWRGGLVHRFPFPTASGTNFSLRRKALYRTRIHSPRAQTVTCGLFWADHFLNGEPLARTDAAGLGNRQVATLRLRKGWNRLAGVFDVVGEIAVQTFGLPTAAGLRLAAEDGAGEGFFTRLISPGDEAAEHAAEAVRAWSKEDTETASVPAPEWEFVEAASIRRAPARQVAWDRPAEPAQQRALDGRDAFELETGPDGLAILNLDFASEFFGHPVFTLTTDKPCIVDVAYDEFLREDGCIDLFRAHWQIQSADRFDCPAGETTVEGFHNRGGRFLQFNLRAAPGTRLRVSAVAVREFKTPTGTVGRFACSAPFWNWLWDTGLTTLDASLEDVWSDSPWREQGCYLGDSLVQFHAHACLSSDMRLPRRILRLFAESQKPDGQICCVVPAAMDRAHPDFSLIFVRFLRDYWAASADDDLVRELWPTLLRLLRSETWVRSPEGLVRTTGGTLFIDWSVESEARQGFSSVLNAFFFDALQCAAELAPLVGEDAAPWRDEAETIRAAMDAQLWDEALGRYRCTRLEDGTEVAGRALHGNTIAWARGLADPAKADRILPWLLGEIDGNGAKIIAHKEKQPLPPRSQSGQLEYYFLFYLLEGLGARGRAAEGGPVIHEMWGLMYDAGASTFWESVLQSYFKEGSLCHSWAVAPSVMAVRDLLGYRPLAGEPNRVRIQPQPCGIKQAEGDVPHPAGIISIRWWWEADDFHLKVAYPESADVECLPPAGVPEARFHCHR